MFEAADALRLLRECGLQVECRAALGSRHCQPVVLAGVRCRASHAAGRVVFGAIAV